MPRTRSSCASALAELGAPLPAAPRWSSVGGRRRRPSAFPCVLKTTRGGYDGKGVWFVGTPDECAPAFEAAARTGVRLLAEELVDRSGGSSPPWWRAAPSGQAAAYPVVESTQRDGICREVIAPAPDLDPDLAARAQALALRIAGELDVTGVLAVELFETDRRPGARQRARDAPPQHRPLDPGRRRHRRSSRTTCAPCSTCRSARPAARARWTVMVNILGGPTDRSPVRRLPARPRSRPAAARAPLRQGACGRVARSGTSTPTATTSKIVSSAPAMRRRGSRGDLGNESE